VGNAVLKPSGGAPLASLSAALLLGVWIIELGLVLQPNAAISRIGTAGLAAFVLLALFRARMHIRLLFVTVVGASFLIAWRAGDFHMLFRGFERAQIFGAFLPSVLLLRATVETSPQLESLRRGVTALDRGAVRNWTFYGSHVLGAILNVGAMAILAPVVNRNADDAERRALASSAARGVGTAVMWSPFFVALAFISQLVPAVPIWQPMLIGFGLSVIGFALSYVLFTRGLGGRGFAASLRGLRPLATPTVVMVAAVLGASFAFNLSGLQSVALSIPVLCGAYLLLRARAAAAETARKTLASFARLADELLIVVGATVLGVAVASLPMAREIGTTVTPGLIAGYPLLLALVAVLVGLGLLGLHPMIGASILVPVLVAGPFGIAPPVLVSATVFAWALSASIAIWTLPVAAAASSFGVPVQQVTTRRTYGYAALYAVIALGYLGAVNALLA